MTEHQIGLRRWQESDAAWYAEASRDEATQRFTTDPPDLTAAQVASAIRDSNARTDRDAFLICSANGKRRLGNLAVEYRDEVAEVSYWVARDVRGRGVATRALTALLEILREQARVSAVQLWTHADNTASRRAAEHAGFIRDPSADCDRTIKGAPWPTVAYRKAL